MDMDVMDFEFFDIDPDSMWEVLLLSEMEEVYEGV